jgi:hypothetical protein
MQDRRSRVNQHVAPASPVSSTGWGSPPGAATQQHREALLEMLVQSDPYPVARDPAEALSLPMSSSARA